MNEDMTGMFAQLERSNSSLNDHKVDLKACKNSWYHKDFDVANTSKYYYHADEDWFKLDLPAKKVTTSTASTSTSSTTTAVESAPTTSEATTSAAKKETKKRKKPEKAEAAEEKTKPKAEKASPKKKKAVPVKKSPKKKAKKEKEEDIKPLKKNASIILGSGDWKKDRFGRLVKLDKSGKK